LFELRYRFKFFSILEGRIFLRSFLFVIRALIIRITHDQDVAVDVLFQLDVEYNFSTNCRKLFTSNVH